MQTHIHSILHRPNLGLLMANLILIVALHHICFLTVIGGRMGNLHGKMKISQKYPFGGAMVMFRGVNSM